MIGLFLMQAHVDRNDHPDEPGAGEQYYEKHSPCKFRVDQQALSLQLELKTLFLGSKVGL